MSAFVRLSNRLWSPPTITHLSSTTTTTCNWKRPWTSDHPNTDTTAAYPLSLTSFGQLTWTLLLLLKMAICSSSTLISSNSTRSSDIGGGGGTGQVIVPSFLLLLQQCEMLYLRCCCCSMAPIFCLLSNCCPVAAVHLAVIVAFPSSSLILVPLSSFRQSGNQIYPLIWSAPKYSIEG